MVFSYTLATWSFRWLIGIRLQLAYAHYLMIVSGLPSGINITHWHYWSQFVILVIYSSTEGLQYCGHLGWHPTMLALLAREFWPRTSRCLSGQVGFCCHSVVLSGTFCFGLVSWVLQPYTGHQFLTSSFLGRMSQSRNRSPYFEASCFQVPTCL